MMIFVRPGGRVTFFWAKDLICYLTTAMPRSSEAFSSKEASLKLFSSNYRTMHSTLDVFPTPGGPERMRLGMVPCDTNDLSMLI